VNKDKPAEKDLTCGDEAKCDQVKCDQVLKKLFRTPSQPKRTAKPDQKDKMKR